MTAPTIAILDNDPSFLSVMHDLLTAAGYRTLRCRPRDVRDVHMLVRRFQPATRHPRSLVAERRRWLGVPEAPVGGPHHDAYRRDTHLRTGSRPVAASRPAARDAVPDGLDAAQSARMLRAIAAVLGPSFVGASRIGASLRCQP